MRNTNLRTLMATLGAVAMVAFGTSPVAAADGDPYVVKDIRAGDASSDPRDLAAVGDVLYFNADDGSHGRELWRSDGTTGGTRMVRDIAPGTTASTPREMTPLGNGFLFSALDSVGGRELWISDGTRDGTRRLVDIRPGPKGSKPESLTVAGTLIYFTADDGVHGRELWTTDGTTAGTRLVKDLTRGANLTGPRELTALGSRLYMVARTGLWKVDAGATSVRSVLDKKGHAIRRPGSLVASGANLFFVADNPSGDRSLWRTTGTNTSTRALLDHVTPQNLTGVDGRLFFSLPGAPGVLSQLWKSDGTRPGTTFVKDVWTVTEMTAVGSFVFFAATNPDGWEELYVSNGTSDGTRWNFSHQTFGDQGLDNMVDFNGVAYYSWHNYLWNAECRATSCATGGANWQPVVPYADDGGTTSWSVRNLAVVGDTLFYSGWDAHAPGDHGQELWAYVP